ncbi:hypothetical protein DFQ28_003389 [Apophysomyces sp. BC1034]|nr:hypothetical protein DFQ30_006476 [Apophysomyces sp. BC1015]KAG0176903.1 hypothetical protein DFQ29_005474 [Apophysomyces sp. BC1021]KAG0189432.1 hypothetical protein DFQ28_003389 [Apophysomyces sp. BC1034]
MGEWVRDHPTRVGAIVAAIVLVICAAVLVPILMIDIGLPHQTVYRPPLPSPTVEPGEYPDGRGLFDDSAQANPHSPPLSEPFRYGTDRIRGVNLGGWLVIEPFITPSLFDQFSPAEGVVDEWGLCTKLGPEEARRQLEKHYASFITEDDFRRIAAMGLNHVRIPIGYWAVLVDSSEPYVSRLSWDYLLKGIQWARKYGLRVMVELHSAPGSQNGWNHSGKSGQIGWLNGTLGDENAKRTLEIIKDMVRYFNKPEWAHVIPVLGVLNEPAIFRLDKDRVKAWYRESYDAIRQITGHGNGPYLTYHEGFLGMPAWAGFFTKYDRVILETHTYLIFDHGLVSMPREKQAMFPCGSWRQDLRNSMASIAPTMVGEFSLATNDCGKYLNGVGLGTRYEGTLVENGETSPAVCPGCNCTALEDWKTWTEDYKSFLRQFIERQMDAFEAGLGWFFWTYKTEDHANPHWDYLLGWEQGWVPHDANDRKYSCNPI